MKDWVLGSNFAHILGRVKHHITGIEIQHRGSCHSKTVTTPKREHRSESAEAALGEGRAHKKLLGEI